MKKCPEEHLASLVDSFTGLLKEASKESVDALIANRLTQVEEATNRLQNESSLAQAVFKERNTTSWSEQ